MLIFLKGCGNYQLTFNNLNFSLTKEELIAFTNYLKRIDIDYWEKEYQHSIYKRKSIIQGNKQFHYSDYPMVLYEFLLSTESPPEILR